MRLLNRPLAFILAAALTVAAIIVIIEVIAKGVGHGPLVLHWTTWYHWAKRTHWNQTVIVVWSAILIVIGLLILIIELKPRRVTRLSLRSDQRATDAAVTRGGLAGTLRAAATRVDGVSAAAVVVRRRRARVSAPAAPRAPRRPRPPRSPQRAGDSSRPGPPEPAGSASPAAPSGAGQLPESLMHADRNNRFVLTLFGL